MFDLWLRRSQYSWKRLQNVKFNLVSNIGCVIGLQPGPGPMPARLGDRDPGPVNGPVTGGAYKVPVIGKPGLDVN